MGGSKGDKIRSAFIRETMPLFEVWVNACQLDDVEADILWLKCFDESDPTEDEILETLKSRHGYYYSDRYFRKHWKKIRKKIYSIIP